MKTLELHKQTIWYDEDLIKDDLELVFDSNYWQQQDKILGSAQGRGTTWFVQTDSLPAALRHYRRGGLFGKIVKDHYWFCGWNKTRSFEEFQLLQHLLKSGVNVPAPIAARAVKRTICYQADILTQKIEQAQDLVSILQKQTITLETYGLIGEQIAKMHKAGVNHTDLNIHNILLDSTNNVWIIDFDKCHIEAESKNSDSQKDNANQQNNSWKRSNLNRLLRSFRKELNKGNIQWLEDTDWKALKSGYNSQTI